MNSDHPSQETAVKNTMVTSDSQTPSFTSFDLNSALQANLAAAGFTHCTPIQAQTLPHTLNGKDIVGQAQTGTGKTAAFLIATVETILRNKQQQINNGTAEKNGLPALILAPTRELAIQIHKDFIKLAGQTPLRAVLAYGGTNVQKQKDELLKGMDILIGTPGRIIDFYKQAVFRLDQLQVMVLDEADRMFDLGFIDDIRYLYKQMPAADERLNLMFSATFAQKVLELAYEHMHQPEFVKIQSESVTADKIVQSVYYVSFSDKHALMTAELNKLSDSARSIIFVNTKRAGEELGAVLNANGHNAFVFSGDVKQHKRQRMLQNFSQGKFPILIATDVAARGLHIPDVSHVFNYDLPQNIEDYVHRIGRTARAGASGTAISFGCDDYVMVLPDIEEYIGYKIPSIETPSELPSLKAADLSHIKQRFERKGNKGGHGRNSSRGPRGSREANNRNQEDAWRREQKPKNNKSEKELEQEFHQKRLADEQLARTIEKESERLREYRRRIAMHSMKRNKQKRKGPRISTPPLALRREDQSAI